MRKIASALQDIVVLDLSSYVAGPYGCALLGDVGAEVIKIEPPGGDMHRYYPSNLDGEYRAFLGVNRNKRSIVLNLKHAEGRAAFYRLVEQAHVVVHNFRTAVPRSLGIDYETLRARRPDLIYCSLTGYGDNGPLQDHPGYDQMLQCFTGLAHIQGGSTEQPQILRGSIVDYYASSLIAFAVSSALVHRTRTGEGQHVKLSLMRSAIALQAGRFIWAASESRYVPKESEPGRVSGAFPTKDGYLYLQSSTPAFWKALCGFMGFPELAQDSRYDTVQKRYDHSDEILPRLKEALMRRTALEWEQLMLGEVPCIAVRTIDDMFDDPQILAQELIVDHEHPRIGKYRSMDKAVQMGIGDNSTTRAPMLGEHTDEVLARFGFRGDEITALRASGTAA
ncbi:CoA transferase [Bradyrhizobium sp. UFLA05-153]